MNGNIISTYNQAYEINGELTDKLSKVVTI